MVSVFYGIEENKKNVTSICLNRLTRNNIITIPLSDRTRADIFGDHLYGIEKKVFVIIGDTEHEIDSTHIVKIHLGKLTIYHFKPEVFVYYGAIGNKKNVTDICLNRLTHNNIITIPPDDHERNAIFGDHLFGTEKKIFVLFRDLLDEDYEYDTSHKIIINLQELTIHTEKTTSNDIIMKYGFLNGHLEEHQTFISTNLHGSEKVLQIGTDTGIDSLIIASRIDNKNFVLLETNTTIVNYLEENKSLNNFTFQIEKSILSKRKMIESEWETIPSDILELGYNWATTITLDDLYKYDIEFDTLVLDCRIIFFYILLDIPEILNNINLIIVKNNYPDIHYKKVVDCILTKWNFYIHERKEGGWGLCREEFYEVWKKR